MVQTKGFLFFRLKVSILRQKALSLKLNKTEFGSVFALMFHLKGDIMKIQELTKQLKTYGLNPQEWAIRREKANSYKIISRQDQELCFRGKIKFQKRRPMWSFIELAPF